MDDSAGGVSIDKIVYTELRPMDNVPLFGKSKMIFSFFNDEVFLNKGKRNNYNRV